MRKKKNRTIKRMRSIMASFGCQMENITDDGIERAAIVFGTAAADFGFSRGRVMRAAALMRR